MGTVLIASELQALLPADPIPGHAVVWVTTGEPLPAGSALAVIPLWSRRIDAGVLDLLPALRIVANCAVGTDNIDIGAALRRGVVVTNTPGVLTEATADLTWALILAVARRIKEGQRLMADGGWEGWHPTQLLGMELGGRSLGIVGAGRIGRAVGRRARGFGMRTVYAARDDGASPNEELEGPRMPFSEVLAVSDVVSVHLPSTPGTLGLFDDDAFARMKPGALFINTARGDVVDEEALLRAVVSGNLGGAGLDVYAAEPRVPTALVEHPRIVTLPHVGSATMETRRGMAELAVRNVQAVLEGQPPVTPVSR